MKRIELVVLTMTFLLLSAITTGFTSKNIQQNTLDTCLNKNPASASECLMREFQQTDINKCYQKAETLQSNLNKEITKEFCFYRIAEFKNISQCIGYAHKFAAYDVHDGALFDCYLEFQLSTNHNECVKIAKLLRLPEKRKYLLQQCSNL